MKISLFAAVAAAVSFSALHAQNVTTPPPKAPIDVLTQAEKDHLEADHQKALDTYPQLLQEEQHLQAEIQALHSGGSVSKETIMKQFVAHRISLEAAMLKIDPTIQPVIDKIHAAQAQIKAAKT